MRNECNTFGSSIWGADHDFTLEEVLTEIAYFRGESYHTIRECGEPKDAADGEEEIFCIRTNFSSYANMIRSGCKSWYNFLLLSWLQTTLNYSVFMNADTIDSCKWNGSPFDCCKFFAPMQTELGLCYALNSMQVDK